MKLIWKSFHDLFRIPCICAVLIEHKEILLDMKPLLQENKNSFPMADYKWIFGNLFSSYTLSSVTDKTQNELFGM